MVPSLQTATPSIRVAQGAIGSSEPVKNLSELIAEMAVRVFFIITAVSMAASYLPIAFQAVVLPLVAIGSTFLSAFLFCEEEQTISPPIPALSAHAPRGIVNQGNDCAFIAMSQVLDSDPEIVKWIRLQINSSQKVFFRFLRSYQVPEKILSKFPKHPMESGPLFTDRWLSFLGEKHPLLVEKFKKIFQAQLSLHEYWKAFDLAREKNLSVADVRSSELRRIVHQILPSLQTNADDRGQVDVQEIFNAIVDLLPDSQKIRIRETYIYNLDGKLPILNQEGSIRSKEEPHSFLSVAIPDKTPKLREMLSEHTQEQTQLQRRNVSGVDQLYPTMIQREFLDFPTSLRIHLKRFFRKENVSSKNNGPLEIPEQIRVQIRSGEKKLYKLVSFINHHGTSMTDGHYTAARIIGGERFLIDDASVTLVDLTRWQNLLQQAYLLCYLPSPDAPS